jgi:hypothetical protein
LLAGRISRVLLMCVFYIFATANENYGARWQRASRGITASNRQRPVRPSNRRLRVSRLNWLSG